MAPLRLTAHSVVGAAGSDDRAVAILRTIFDYFDLPREVRNLYRRDRSARYARQVAMYLCTELTALTPHEIAAAISCGDVTRVRHATIRVRGLLDERPQARREIAELTARITGPA